MPWRGWREAKGDKFLFALQRTGCRWTGVTLSMEQLKEAQQRVKAAGLGDRITLLFCDYRDVQGAGGFDKVVSCEMIEAVGREHMDSFFHCLGRMLRVGGTAVLQAS
jgi:cyclopropane-fatty-acyl-phospholipid synthase